ncbi:hypothetical protein ACFSCX_01950 [Bacillus salitolerans]|uniref:Uncharacterized protein n=1 Tax=Bacillus salitolerans TaxID=1437434 RepID=A0ABW4LJB6_9BACI
MFFQEKRVVFPIIHDWLFEQGKSDFSFSLEQDEWQRLSPFHLGLALGLDLAVALYKLNTKNFHFLNLQKKATGISQLLLF